VLDYVVILLRATIIRLSNEPRAGGQDDRSFDLVV